MVPFATNRHPKIFGAGSSGHRSSFLIDGLVSGISNQRRSTAASATAAMPRNPAARPRLPATRPESVVLSEAPTPDIVPTNPCARLNRPVRDQRRQHAQHRSADAVEYLSSDENYWIGGLDEHQRSDRQRCDSNQQKRPATPPIRRPAPRPCRHHRHDHLGDHDQRCDDERGKELPCCTLAPRRPVVASTH